MNNEFFEALEMLESEKGIPLSYLLEKIKSALALAVKRHYGTSENAIVNINEKKKTIEVEIRKLCVERVSDYLLEISFEEARKINPEAELGQYIDVKIETKQFGRIAAQTAKHVIRQGIREAERGMFLEEMQKKRHEILNLVISRVDPRRGNVTLEFGKNTVLLPKSEYLPNDEMIEGRRLKVYVVDAEESEKGPRVMISRTHPGFVKKLFELEVPEISDGVVEIKAIAREAGIRTKLAVLSNDENVDPVGALIGSKGSRVEKIIEALSGEKIDVVKYSEVPEEMIAAALAPAQTISVIINEEDGRHCKVIVPDNQLSLAIGNKGQNARLAARLTGFRIDIKPLSEMNTKEE